MSRSAGVTINLFLLAATSLLCLWIGALMTAAVLAGPLDQSPGRIQAPQSLLYLPGAFEAAIGIWGMVTAVGLWFLRGWARISALLLGGTHALFDGAMLAGLFLSSALGLGSDLSPGALAALTVLYGAQFLAGVWWLIYFNLKSVRGHFLAGAQPQENLGPLSITVIAWHLLAAAPILVAAAWLRWPAVFLHLLLTGWPAALVYLVWAAASLWIGVDLLRLKPRALDWALYYLWFALANVLAFWLAPGAEERNRRAAEAFRNLIVISGPGINPLERMQLPLWLSGLAGVLTCVVPLWYLHTRKRKFLDAANPSSVEG